MEGVEVVVQELLRVLAIPVAPFKLSRGAKRSDEGDGETKEGSSNYAHSVTSALRAVVGHGETKQKEQRSRDVRR